MIQMSHMHNHQEMAVQNNMAECKVNDAQIKEFIPRLIKASEMNDTTSAMNTQLKLMNIQKFWEEGVTSYLDQNVCAVDRNDVQDPQCIAEYAEEVCQHMLNTENMFLPHYGYM